MDLVIAIVIDIDDPRAADVTALLEAHLTFARATSPSCHVHALEIEKLLEPSITFVSARRGETLLGIGALKQLDNEHAEVKSMHTTESARGQGVGRAIVAHLLNVAAEAGCKRVSLETGTQGGFIAARSLYESIGFAECEPFADHTSNAHSICMTIDLEALT